MKNIFKSIYSIVILLGVIFFSLCSNAWAEDENSNPVPSKSSSHSSIVFSFGVFGGGAIATPTEAVDGYKKTSFEYGTPLGASAYIGSSGLGLEAYVENYKFKLTENSDDLGTLEMTPIVLCLKLQSIPKEKSGWGGHADLGVGYMISSFKTGSDIDSIAAEYPGISIDVKTDPAFIFDLGFGGDYFFTPNISLLMDFKWLFYSIKDSWTASYMGQKIDLGIDGNLQPSNIQLLLGVKYWIR